jgi:hypothetical protein
MQPCVEDESRLQCFKLLVKSIIGVSESIDRDSNEDNVTL